MEKNFTQQEILLVTGTGFASRQYCERDSSDNTKYLTANEKLMKACWDGLLSELLPEIFFFTKDAKKLYLWQLREANRFFALEMGEYPAEVDKELSIDPYRFLATKAYN